MRFFAGMIATFKNPDYLCVMAKKMLPFWIGLTLVLALLFLVSLFLGSVDVPVFSILLGDDLSPIDQHILFESRIPRALVAVFGGSALALAGLLMQTLFRNPLAGPSVLGITSGASLAVAILTLGVSASIISQYQVVLAAIIGSFAILLLILAVAKKFFDVTAVLIVGLMLSFFTSAIVSLLQSFASADAIKAYIFWGFGSFSGVSLSDIPVFIFPILLVLTISPFFIKPLNALLLGEMHAGSMGINMKSLRIKIMAATGILAGVVTAFCGPVAFLGLASPHIARFVFKSVDHRIILPATILFGGIMALLCDIISRLPGSDYAIPLNTVCAFMGAPVVIYLIVAGRNKKFLL